MTEDAIDEEDKSSIVSEDHSEEDTEKESKKEERDPRYIYPEAPKIERIKQFKLALGEREELERRQKKRHRILFGIVVGIPLLIGVIASFLIQNAPTSREPGSLYNIDGTVNTQAGEVEISSDGGNTWTTIDGLTKIATGAFVRTENNSQASVTLDDGSVFRLNPETTLHFRSLNSLQIAVTVEEGEAYGHVIEAGDRVTNIIVDDEEFITSQGFVARLRSGLNFSGLEVFAGEFQSRSDAQLTVLEGQRFYTANPVEDKQDVVSSFTAGDIDQDSFITANVELDRTIAVLEDSLGILSDFTPPNLELIEPADGLITQESTITVSGSSDNDATLQINGNLVDFEEGTFNSEIELHSGNNSVHVVATDEQGNSVSKVILVHLENDNTSEQPQEAQAEEEGNSGEDEDSEPASTTTEPDRGDEISLGGARSDFGVSLSWNTNADAKDGFYVTYSQSPQPSLSSGDYVYIENGDVRSFMWGINDGNLWNVQICVADGNSCGATSQVIEVRAPSIEFSGVADGEINLTLNDATATWSYQGSADAGFVVVAATSGTPTYPNHAIAHVPSQTNSFTLPNYLSDEKYNIRVCKWTAGLEGGCQDYSNAGSLKVSN